MDESLTIGIDPGLTNTGWAILRKKDQEISLIKCGRIKTSPNEPIGYRLLVIHNEIMNILNRFDPLQASIENSFVNCNSKTSMKLSCARGAIMLTFAIYGLSVTEYLPNMVKSFVSGYGHSDKSGIARIINIILPNTLGMKISKDEYDAIAIALCHIYKMG